MSIDAPEVTRDKLASLGLEYPLLADPDFQAIDAFGVRHPEGMGHDIARPATFLIDRRGRVVWRDLTDNWRVRVRSERVLEQLAAIP